MANKSLFRSAAPSKPKVPVANTVNEAGGVAYKLEDRAALAQLVSTGCFNNTFYVTGEDQLKQVLALAKKVDTDFLAKVAVFSRESGYMKDAPALLAATLTTRGAEGRAALKKVFPRVIDNGKMLRNFVQILRSGQVGRKSLGTFPKTLVRGWMESQTDDRLFKNSVGNDPSMADVIKMVHPKPATKSREALYAYIIGKDKGERYLPALVKAYEQFKKGAGELPDVPFEMLTALPLSEAQWKDIAKNLSWTQLRMNLNTLQRHNVFSDRKIVSELATKLADRELIKKAKVFPYQLMAAYMHADEQLPMLLREALQSALDTSLENIPEIGGRVAVFPDHSGSMDSPVTGNRGYGQTTKVTCKMVAALVAAAYMRKNPDTLVLPFADRVTTVRLNPRDSVMTNAQKLAQLPSGGTKCSAPLEYMAQHGENVDLAVFVSDNESWIGSSPGWWSDKPTDVLKAWEKVRAKNKGAKMVCVDIQPNTSTQAPDRKDILNVGGFSDRVFDIVNLFHRGELDGAHWVGVIEGIEL